MGLASGGDRAAACGGFACLALLQAAAAGRVPSNRLEHLSLKLSY